MNVSCATGSLPASAPHGSPAASSAFHTSAKCLTCVKCACASPRHIPKHENAPHPSGSATETPDPASSQPTHAAPKLLQLPPLQSSLPRTAPNSHNSPSADKYIYSEKCTYPLFHGRRKHVFHL